MNSAEHEAREIARRMFGVAVPSAPYLPEWREKIWADALLRFAREYGPELAWAEVETARLQQHESAMRIALPPLSPVEDTTPPGWARRNVTPPERGKPF